MNWTSKFNAWRMNYNKMTYMDHRKFYEEIYETFPKQSYYNWEGVSKFIKLMTIPLKVVEFGGWDGDLAGKCIRINNNIVYWHNYEIASQLVNNTICKDERYECIVGEDFIWDLNIEWDMNVFISTHAIEHITLDHFEKLVVNVIKYAKHVILDAPIGEHKAYSFAGSSSTHIFNGSWVDIDRIMYKNGFDVMLQDKYHPPKTSHVSIVKMYMRMNG